MSNEYTCDRCDNQVEDGEGVYPKDGSDDRVCMACATKPKPDVAKNGKDFDDFLDDMTHKVANNWLARGGPSLSDNAKFHLNDLLTEFFSNL